MDNQDSWWDFDSDISAEFDDETEDSTLPPSFMNLKMNPSNGAYVSTSFLPAEVDDGFVIGTTLAILSALLIILIAVALVVYSKILRRKPNTIDLGNDVYRTTIENKDVLVPLQKNQLDKFESFPIDKDQHITRLLQTV